MTQLCTCILVADKLNNNTFVSQLMLLWLSLQCLCMRQLVIIPVQLYSAQGNHCGLMNVQVREVTE